MRLVVQRVNSASVSVNKKTVGEIEKGLFVLFGAGDGDTKEQAEVLADKLAKLRVMSDENDPTSPKATRGQGKMNLSVKDVDASILVVSQFTLYADTSAGNRPSFIKAAKPEIANELYKYFIENLRKHDINVQTGSFGEYMNISTEIDGPVTILFET